MKRRKFFELGAVQKKMVVVLAVIITLGAVIVSEFTIKTSVAHQEAIAYVAQHKEVLDITGPITGYGFWVSGRLNSPTGYSNLKFKIHGELRDVHVQVNLSSDHMDEWKVDELIIL
jgi:hypothetical protein